MEPNSDVLSLWRFTSNSIERILDCLGGLDENDLNWKPLDSANSLYVLAIHAMGNTTDNILGLLCGRTVSRNRDDEFKIKGIDCKAAWRQWVDLRETIAGELSKLSDDALQSVYNHPRRGQLTGIEVMVVAATQAAEHKGHAELTMDLLAKARGRPPIPRDRWGNPIRHQ